MITSKQHEQLEELLTLGVDKVGYYDTMIVTIKYKYNHEKDYRIDNEVIRNINGSWVWLCDWYEGEDDVQFIGIMPLDCVTTMTKEELENEQKVQEQENN